MTSNIRLHTQETRTSFVKGLSNIIVNTHLSKIISGSRYFSED
jgi:hypothetical protein